MDDRERIRAPATIGLEMQLPESRISGNQARNAGSQKKSPGLTAARDFLIRSFERRAGDQCASQSSR
jgi:hypothetical protein